MCKLGICKICGRKYHVCTSCGWGLDGDLFPLWEGYCSWECAIKNEPEIRKRHKELLDED